MNRRALLIASLTAPVIIGATCPSMSQPADGDVIAVGNVPPLPENLAGKDSQPPANYVELEQVGTGKPDSSEIDTAFELLMGSPYNCAPIEVAEYFLAIGAGAYGNGVRQYAREWPERANPIIYHFFAATQTSPSGDVTAWCAAFTNWCILRSHAINEDEIGKSPGVYSKSGKSFSTESMKKHSTNSAASGSFRCWDETISPKRGELVVFKNNGTDGATKYCQGQGHVAFYLRQPKVGTVRCLGGNQIFKGSGGAITIADMPIGAGSRFMKFVSLR